MTIRMLAVAVIAACAAITVIWLMFDDSEAQSQLTGGGTARAGAPAILVIGDSLFSIHAGEAASIPDALSNALGRPVRNAAVGGTRIAPPDLQEADDAIPNQWARHREDGPHDRAWPWVLVDGGGNDLGHACDCGACGPVVDALIAPNARSGAIPDLLRDVAQGAERVMFVGYFTPLPDADAFSACGAELAAFNDRLKRFADATPGVWFVSAGETVTPRAPQYYSDDGFHASVAGAAAIGRFLAQKIRDIEARHE